MKPIINVEDITEYEGHEHGAFEAKYASVGTKIGAEQLGYNITIINSLYPKPKIMLRQI